MTRRSGRLQSKSESVTPQSRKMTRTRREQSYKKKTSKRQSGDVQNQRAEEESCSDTPMVGIETLNEIVLPSPLPTLSWGCSEDVWVKMLSKDLKYQHNKSLTERHPSILPKMRAVLLDWLMEVSEAYMLHRQTFYLAQDFFDRYMLTQEGVDKNRLQLTGITALFIACKMEEINPPKLLDLAYVTDGACFEEEILHMELIMLKALNWDLCPETVISWMKLYLQMASLYDQTNLLVPQFSTETYLRVTQLLDLCILDVNALDFSYGLIAAAALCHFTPVEVVQRVSGLTWEKLLPCVDWMAPFVETLVGYANVPLKQFVTVPEDDWHNIQIHGNYLNKLDEAQQRQFESSFVPLTPPSSSERPALSS
ncbi:G1/S-specific cyclin-E2-like isoform X1 [Sardina pilchardus]|uniref:G1/S-specific cyclin-E2-like isoform X1 n=1 Tax=Sardina pilchardus TaxID=27697 RepID=UPI002E14F278